MPRAVLMQQHAHQGPTGPHLAMRRTLHGRPNQPHTVQMHLRHSVAEPVAMALHQHLVEMLHREVRILVLEQPKHPLQLHLRRPSRRRPTKPPVRQPSLTFLRNAVAPAPEGPLLDPQQLRRLTLRDLAPLLPLQQTRKTHPPNSLVDRCPLHRPTPSSEAPSNRTVDELQTPDRSRANYTTSWLVISLRRPIA
jgi:hypothetical protein